MAVGTVSGVFPLPGATTVVCLALCALTRANMLVANVTNLLLTPVDILLIPSFVCVPPP